MSAAGVAEDRARDAGLARHDGAVAVQLGAGGRLRDLHQQAPCRAFLPRVDPGQSPEVVFANVAGGVAGGDRLDYALALADGAAAVGTTQAAEKVYRAIEQPSRLHTRLAVGAGCRLDWLPQETILFDGARLARRTTVDLAGDARFLGVEWLVLGRHARGETVRHGAVLDGWRVRVDGRLAWADGLRLGGDVASIVSQAAALGGATAIATLVHAAPGAAERVDEARGLLSSSGVRAAATAVNGMLIARLLATEPLRLRTAVSAFLAGFRRDETGGARPLPRVWGC